MKTQMALVCGVLALLLAVAGYFVPEPYWQGLMIGCATSFLSLSVGVVLVNIYLERHARQGAVISLLILSNQSIADFHNHFLSIGWAKYGRDGWGKILDEYIDAGGKAEALRQETRDFLYTAFKSDAKLRQLLGGLDETLTELSRMVGWSLDARLLKACLDSRIAITRLKSISLDDSANAIGQVTEHLLDAEIQSQTTRSLLMSIGEISDD